MALITAQKFQALRLPIAGGTFDSTDQKAILGIFQVESEAGALTANQKRWVLRLPIVDGTVDENDAWGFLQIPQSGGGGNDTLGFSLTWNIDPTIQFNDVVSSASAGVAITLGSFIPVMLATQNVLTFVGRTYSVRFNNEVYK